MNAMLRSMIAGAALAMLAAHGLAQEKNAPGSRTLPGGGVGDPAGKIGYFPNTSGGIDALELATGNLLWATKDANRPLLATDGRLYAQKSAGNSLRFAAFESKDGKRIFETALVPLPDWASVEKTYGRTFQLRLRLEGKELTISWDARAFYAGGAAPPREILEASRKEASGVVRIDVDAGALAVLSPKQLAETKIPPLAAVGEVNEAKVGTLTLSIQDEPGKNPRNPFQQRRILRASDATAVVWQRDILGPVVLPPPP